MKRMISLLLTLLLLLSMLSACGKQTTDPPESTAPVVNTEPVATEPKEEKNVVKAANAEYLSNEDFRKAIAEYKTGYTPIISRMENGVLNGTLEFSFETDYDISNATLYRIGCVDETDSNVELQGYSGKKPKVNRDGRKVTVDIGWWHESNGWVKSHPLWSYIVCVEDAVGTFHNYYFRVEYATTDVTGLNTEKDYEAFIDNNYWYRRALGCVFDKPENLPAYLYFYSGVGDYTQATEEELAFILNAFVEKYPNGWAEYGHEYKRLPVAKINEALSILGVTIEDIKIPSQWAYNENLDCYYFWVTDAYIVGRWSVTKVEKGSEGIIAVYWEAEQSIMVKYGEFLDNPKMVMTMQQQPDGTYRILSNVPQS